MAKRRLDQRLVDDALAPSRARAQALILAGSVRVNGARLDKSGTMVADEAVVAVNAPDSPYVSRGGVKLAAALDAFGVSPVRLACLDVGASTGGFTDCLLQRGARSVVAVDVGYGQLAHALRIDPRVVVKERTNAKTLTPDDIGGQADLTVVDASFIGLEKLLPAIARCTRMGGALVALIKPQFEAGREEVARGKGVIRDATVRERAIRAVLEEVGKGGFRVLGEADCVLPGPKGNLEAFVHGLRE